MTDLGTGPRLSRLQIWATIAATAFTGLAVIVSAISLGVQVSALRDSQDAQRTQFASRVSWWVDTREESNARQPKANLVVNNASPKDMGGVAAVISYVDGPVRGNVFLASVVPPCTRLAVKLDAPQINNLTSEKQADGSWGYGHIGMSAVLFSNGEATWRLDDSGSLATVSDQSYRGALEDGLNRIVPDEFLSFQKIDGCAA